MTAERVSETASPDTAIKAETNNRSFDFILLAIIAIAITAVIATLLSEKGGKIMPDITIDKSSLVYDDNEFEYKTRVPGTFGEDIRYLWIKKTMLMKSTKANHTHIIG